MLKKFLHSSLVGMLLFSSFGNASLFAQQPPSLPEDPLFQAEPLQPDNEPEENDIYINIFQPQETDDQQIAQQIAQQHAQQHAQQGVVTP
ncbi:MAG: hypothetical protein LBG59_09125 [Candidatus Peribacteria bacterium]|nr:hypothetical protein [Candidatus Peribacteria bacterium]